MQILIDIDGTIATRNQQCFLLICNRRLRLGLDQQRLARLTYHTFLEQPEVLACRERLGEERFSQALGWIGLDPHHLEVLLPLPSAHEGVCKLATLGPVGYCTARTVPAVPTLNHKIEQATRIWLTRNQFPNADDVAFCDGLQEKLRVVAQRAEMSGDRVLLVDDLALRLAQEVHALEPSCIHILTEALILCAFGVQEIPPTADSAFPMLPLSSWSEVERLIDMSSHSLHKEEPHACNGTIGVSSSHRGSASGSHL